MVLYVKALKENCENYVTVVNLLKTICDSAGVECSGYDQSLETAGANISLCDVLLESGVTELQIPRVKKSSG